MRTYVKHFFPATAEGAPNVRPQTDLTASRPDPVRAAKVIAALDRFLEGRFDDSEGTRSPKHVRLAEALSRAVADGIVHEGDKLPSESELTQMTPFSLGTVQKAVKSLMTDGLVVRKPGVGTIVRRWRQSMAQPLHCRFSHEGGEFLAVYPVILSRTRIRESGNWTKVLGENATIIRIDRRIMIGDFFPVVTRFYVDADRYPLFARRSVRKLEAQNFKLLMSEQAGGPITRMENQITFVPACDELAAQLDVKDETIVLRIKATARTPTGQALYYQEIFIPPNELELSIESRLDGIAGI